MPSVRSRTALLAVAIVTLALASLAALIRSDAASAYVGAPVPVIENPSLWPSTYNLVTGNIDAVPTWSPEVQDVVSGAEVISSAEPGLALVPAVGLGVLATGAGVAIGTGLDKIFHISCRIASTCEHADHVGTWTVRNTRWLYLATGVAGHPDPGSTSNLRSSALARRCRGVGRARHHAVRTTTFKRRCRQTRLGRTLRRAGRLRAISCASSGSRQLASTRLLFTELLSNPATGQAITSPARPV